ncbi:MAG TPA: carboxypeptidase regulatory-like domain-containing protein [Xanthobacteraceae bacterium]|nr:carboxypeptidase regulatory-like domain-containing protein [Xanthobacteraceae bacterium]
MKLSQRKWLTRLLSAIAATATMALGSAFQAAAQARAPAQPAPEIDANAIGGVVTSRFGPEAGVWVIAETRELGTRFAKMVVTDDFGRFVLPDLPRAHYQVWVRGYGLVDSHKSAGEPGQQMVLTAEVAPNLAAAAQYYPAIYWFSMLRVPDKSQFPGTGPNGNGIPTSFKTQDQWLDVIKTNGCGNCHQIGNYATRTIPEALGHFDSGIAAWARRLQSGPGGTSMVRTMGRLLTPDGGHLAALADWSDRIKKGELPTASPPRPSGIERNLVVTVRDWLDPQHYLHDLTATDKRHPTVNAHGLLYGSTELSISEIPTLDPVNNIKATIHMPVRDPEDTPSSALANPVFAPSPYNGNAQAWDSQANAHSLVMDQEGRIYFTAQVRSPENPPAYCGKDSSLRSAQLYPLMQKAEGFVQNARQVTVYDPKTRKFSFIDTCFGTQHLNFAEDADDTLWFSTNTQGRLAVVGWVNTRKFWQTGDAAASQGWTPLIVDTVGDGKRTATYNEPGQPIDPHKDTRVPYGLYGISVSPTDGAVWGSSLPHPGYIIRIDPGPNPPDTALTEVYKVPMPGYGIRGMDVDRNGVVWVPLDSGHIASFDRRKCTGPLNGPGAEQGNKCPEGWTFYPLPGPPFQGQSGAAENPYYVWVDQHDTLGLGANTPIATGNQSDSLHALVGGRVIELRVPYPMGFFAKSIDGRIDDADGGWKGRGLWVTSGNRTPFHIEGIDARAPGAPGRTPATYSSPLVVNFQLRPNPLAH